MDLPTIRPKPDSPLNATEIRALTRCEDTIKRNEIDSFIETGQALYQIKEDKLWRHYADSFEEYLKLKWNVEGAVFSPARAKQITNSYEASLKVQGVAVPIPPKEQSNDTVVASDHTSEVVVGRDIELGERAARELSGLDKNKAADVLRKAGEYVKPTTGKPPTITSTAIRKAKEAMAIQKEIEDINQPEDEVDENEEEASADRIKEINKILSSFLSGLTKSWKDTLTDHDVKTLLSQDGCIERVESKILAIKTEINANKATVCPVCTGNGCGTCEELGYVNNSLAKLKGKK